MLDEKDLQALAQLTDSKIRESESRMMACFESAIMPKFDLLAEGQGDIREMLVPRSRVDDLEEEVRFLKSVIRQINEDVQKLKKPTERQPQNHGAGAAVYCTVTASFAHQPSRPPDSVFRRIGYALPGDSRSRPTTAVRPFPAP